jgi:hypothetical protein
MELKDWFYNGYSRNELETIFHDLISQQTSTTVNLDTSSWGRCTLARELEKLAPMHVVFG